MGGAFGVNGHRGNVTPYAEANIHDDPDAADRVFTAPWPLVIIGLDVTQQSIFTATIWMPCGTMREPGRFLWDVSRFYLRFYSERIGMAVPCARSLRHRLCDRSCAVHPAQGAGAGHHRGPAIGHTLQKFDDTRHPHDEWAHCPAQQVGVAVRDQALLALYRDTLVAWGKGRR
jgi:hypothetical protein